MGWIPLKETIEVAQPPEAVFAFMDDPAAQASATPGLSRMEDVARAANGGLRCRVVYELLDREWTVDIEATEYAPNERVSYQVTGLLQAELFARFEPLESGTRLHLWGRYQLPEEVDLAPLRKLAQTFTDWAMKRMAETLKAKVEQR